MYYARKCTKVSVHLFTRNMCTQLRNPCELLNSYSHKTNNLQGQFMVNEANEMQFTV